ncbi:uncharacterized protein FFB20_09124 [Fusarium fujikuroi]|uniref:Uncharacterized protein n=2 Tax=Fusarium fujikuroi TaxID=5127 RepID=S0EM91_GIBF5|nr:uncharacterized protein FFUJ_14206 [Fusarium fujikuroi IMI 58289]KLO90134.1 uncharacterized protein Y057_8489 [Fusarium fujikuroi]KLP18870.1 uncharacterized protein LW94_850 [Fusarium fujikuroi]CCT76163.1 uncharacterized protein FFUJ_14206 [Fusarium fujikuroi IMI 58289]SCN92027.1 uncharacterized protein FFB20_09124 [Fusarium fujikuroi]SCO24025.1 uncharacterized protein FFE2_15848 [Fusarium fujikuroi]
MSHSGAHLRSYSRTTKPTYLAAKLDSRLNRRWEASVWLVVAILGAKTRLLASSTLDVGRHVILQAGSSASVLAWHARAVGRRPEEEDWR